ncbi:MAG: hypothetical protein U9N85_10670 [Bacteroidota bacterium]|nr:hypothetical protein [Bacteroidota bacterium]
MQLQTTGYKQRKVLIKIITRALLLILPVYAMWWAYTEYFPLNYNSPTPMRWHFIKTTLDEKNIRPKISKLFLGESRLNAAVNFNKIPNSYSFASGGSTPIELFHIWKKYIRNFPVPDTVFLSVSPRFYTQTFAFWPYAVRSGLIDRENMTGIISEYHKQPKDTVLGTLPAIKFAAYQLHWFGYYQQDIKKNYLFRAKQKNRNMIQDMKARRGGRFHPGLKDSCSALNFETNLKTFKPAPLLDSYFIKLLKSLKRNNCETIFLFLPMNKSSFQRLHPQFVNDYERYMQTVQNRFPKFTIAHKIYAYPDSLFGDASHLNSKGRIIYTDSLRVKF